MHFAGFGDECRAVFLRQNFQQFKQIAIIHRAYHVAHIGFSNAARAHGNGLVQQAERIAHRSLRGASEQGERGGVVGDVFRV